MLLRIYEKKGNLRIYKKKYDNNYTYLEVEINQLCFLITFN